MNTYDWLGSFGLVLILLAFSGNTFRLLTSRSRLFYALNAIGATMACLGAYINAYWSFAVLEAAWLLVSLIGLVKVSQSNRY